MLTPAVCFTCGMPLGDKAPIYHRIRRQRLGRRYGATGAQVSPVNVSMDPTRIDNSMGDILDALKVNKCCRVRLVTSMQFQEHY